jgi:hypothetical protein
VFVCCVCCGLSGRGLCDGLITRPEESYRLWGVVVCDQETSKAWRLKPATGLWKYNHNGFWRQENKQKNFGCIIKINSQYCALFVLGFVTNLPVMPLSYHLFIYLVISLRWFFRFLIFRCPITIKINNSLHFV